MQTYRNALVGLVLAGTLAGCGGMGMNDGMSGTETVGGVPVAGPSDPVMVGGAPMLPTRNIVENAVESADHTTLVAAVQQAGLVETLQSPGPFTVFAPTNAAFDALPAGTVDTLMQDENKAQLTKVLTYHVVPGRLSASDLMGLIEANGGQASLTTAEGGMLTAMTHGDGVAVMDASGNTVMVTIPDVNQSNGVIHVVDGVLLPAM